MLGLFNYEIALFIIKLEISLNIKLDKDICRILALKSIIVLDFQIKF